MELMISNRYSKLTALALLCSLVLAAAAPAAAVTVSESEVPDEGEVGEQVSATIALDDLYQDPSWEEWTLSGETGLENVTWTLTFINPSGETIDKRSYDGQQFNHSGISAETEAGTVTEVRVDVTGEVPAVEEHTYPDEEMFVVATLLQTRGEAGSENEIGSWEAHHFTSNGEMEDEPPGSLETRQALDDAQSTIDDAEEAGADVSDARSSLQNAISAYENGNFGNAVDLAGTASDEAEQARQDQEQSEQQSQLLLFGGLGLVVALLIGGGFWYWRNQQDDYDKLG
jgi:hypothetical protein